MIEMNSRTKVVEPKRGDLKTVNINEANLANFRNDWDEPKRMKSISKVGELN